MNWKKYYEDNLVSAMEAVNEIKSGDAVVFAHAAGEPKTLVGAMVANAANYKDVTVSHMVTMGDGAYTRPEYKDNFTFNGWFLSGTTRKAVETGDADFTPVYFHEVPDMIRRGYFKVDVALVTVSKPDEHGYVSLGVSCDYTLQAVRSARTVLAEVSDKCPYVYGQTLIHVSEIDKFVETSRPLYESAIAPIGETEEAIGKYCAQLIEDGSTLQLGIGAIPNAVLAQLKDKKNLGIHSEMISDGVLELVEAGVINCKEKALDPGKMVVTFLMGTQKLYDFVDKNPMVELKTVDYVNHPIVVAENSKLVCINSALQVDFLGQVVSDSIGTRQFSGVGGQVDFMRGAAMAKDGKAKAIIAMPSVTVKKDGTMISKIVPFIDEGAAVTATRHDADYIITEYGIAHLKGKTLKERARALVEIAHPKFREGLKRQFETRFNCEY